MISVLRGRSGVGKATIPGELASATRSASTIGRRWLVAIANTAPLVILACDSRPASSPMSTPPAAVAAAPTSSPASAAAAGTSYIPAPPGGPTPQWERAVKLFRDANTLQFQQRLDEAIETYQRSLAAFPTAEAHTFLAWTYSWKG